MEDKIVESTRCSVVSVLDKWARSRFPGLLPAGQDGGIEGNLPIYS
jgi:hypothetical protein